MTLEVIELTDVELELLDTITVLLTEVVREVDTGEVDETLVEN